MSLTDLKKTKDGKAKKKIFTIDEFIADAENYAQGTPQIVSKDAKTKLTLKQAILEAKRLYEEKKSDKNPKEHDHKKFRRATFTLSEDAIDQLRTLSLGSDLAKSHILRILIDELCNKEQHEQLKKLLDSKIG
ncbi:MAG: hypothetical protein OCD00_10170 [Colwellia sp.]